MPKESCCTVFSIFLLKYVIFPFVLPLMCLVMPFFRLCDAWMFSWFQERYLSTPGQHGKKVARVQEQVKQWHLSGRKTRMCTGRARGASFGLRTMDKRALSQIQIDDLNCVVEINETNRTVTVEPGMMIGQLTTILTQRGWTIPVIPELEVLTIGGLTCGGGLETSSGKYGQFADTAIEYEVVLSNGEMVTCSRDENTDLFYSIPWSHGTLGFLMAVRFPLLRATKYVKLEHVASTSFTECQRLITEAVEQHEFVEGISYGRDKFVVILGDFSDHPDQRHGPVNSINRWYKPFWYKHVEGFLTSGPDKSNIEFVPLRDYYHRHTRSAFWAYPLLLPYMHNLIFRILFGWIPLINSKLGKRIMVTLGLESLFMGIFDSNYVMQDMGVPIENFQKAFDYLHNTIEIYPLWFCPCKFFNRPGMVRAPRETQLYLNFGIYGKVAKSLQANYYYDKSSRQRETFVIENEGMQGLYVDCMLSPEDFRKMFDMSLYDQVRIKYQCEDAFPDVFSKVSNQARGPKNV